MKDALWFRTANKNYQRMDDDLFAYVAPFKNRIEDDYVSFYKDGWSYFVFINDGTGTFGTFISPKGDTLYDDPIDAMKAADVEIDEAFTRLATGDENDTLEDVQAEASSDRRV